MERVWELIVTYVPPLLGVILFLVVALIVSSWAAAVAARGLRKTRIDKTLVGFLAVLVKWGLMVLAVIACLGVFGVETTSFAAVIGGAVLAIGLAFQGSLGNIAAGVMLLIFRPFKVDDVVEISGEFGKVAELSLFTTEIDTFDNRRIILPNGVVFGTVIENHTHHPIRRVDVSVGVSYAADLDRTREVLTAVAKDVPDTLEDPPPAVALTNLGDSSVDWAVRVWTNTENYWPVKDAATRRVKMALDEAGLEIPFPQMNVHLDKPDGD